MLFGNIHIFLKIINIIKKLLLHKGSMKYYFDYLKNKFSVKYIELMKI